MKLTKLQAVRIELGLEEKDCTNCKHLGPEREITHNGLELKSHCHAPAWHAMKPLPDIHPCNTVTEWDGAEVKEWFSTWSLWEPNLRTDPRSRFRSRGYTKHRPRRSGRST
jgi:hypothetical protein